MGEDERFAENCMDIMEKNDLQLVLTNKKDSREVESKAYYPPMDPSEKNAIDVYMLTTALAQIALEEAEGHPSRDGIVDYIDLVSHSVEHFIYGKMLESLLK